MVVEINEAFIFYVTVRGQIVWSINQRDWMFDFENRNSFEFIQPKEVAKVLKVWRTL